MAHVEGSARHRGFVYAMLGNAGGREGVGVLLDRLEREADDWRVRASSSGG